MIKKKLFYTPGLISLLGLSVASLLYLNSKDVFEKLYVLPVNWGYFSTGNNSEYKAQFFESLHKKKFTEIVLDKNYKNNSIKLNFAKLEIESIVDKQDLNRGIHFNFTDDMPYEALVRIIEMCSIEKTITYYGRDNDFWVFNYNLPTQTSVSMMRCGTELSMRIIDKKLIGVK